MNRNNCYKKSIRMCRLLVMICLFIVATGCGKQEKPRYRIGVSQCSSDTWRDKMNEEMKRELLFHDGSTIEIRCADDSNEKQISDIEYFLDNDFDIIIVAPNEADALTPEISKVYKSGTPVIIFDRRVRGNDYTAYIDLDNENIGRAAGEYIHAMFGDNEIVPVLEITGLDGSTPAEERHKGFIESLSSYGNIKLLESKSGNWESERAEEVIDSLLNIYPQTRVIYAHSDFMALGIADVLNRRGRKDIKILGTDATPEQGIQAIQDGIIEASFIYPTEGHRIIKTAFDILEGREYEKIVHVPALTSVNRLNAEILKRQYALLSEETQNVLRLNEKNEQLLVRYKEQSVFLYTVVGFSIAVLIVLGILIWILMKNIALQKEIKHKNDVLIQERDRHSALYSKLETAIREKKNTDSDFYNKFINIIKEQYSKPDLNTEGIASQLSLGSAQLTRKIKALTNYSPVEILRNYRMEQARNLLLTTNMSINEITFAVGFSSPAYLTKCFREHYGSTPTELRNK